MRRHLRRYVFVLLVGLLLVAISGWMPQSVYACSCPLPPEPAEALEDAVMVFAGVVVDIGDADSRGMREIEFAVSEAWKGVEHREVTIGTTDTGGACGYPFEEQKEYLVYVSENQSVGPSLITGICNRTDTLSTADEDLMVLGTGTQADDLEPGDQTEDGLDLWVLFGSIALFLAIVVIITLLRRWK